MILFFVVVVYYTNYMNDNIHIWPRLDKTLNQFLSEISAGQFIAAGHECEFLASKSAVHGLSKASFMAC